MSFFAGNSFLPKLNLNLSLNIFSSKIVLESQPQSLSSIPRCIKKKGVYNNFGSSVPVSG